ncbi:PIN domain-containing protein [Klebsiella aerogenes]|uniref:PIN domain-containing protein n=1 Tax=Klebsiella aerogenes TaxID=548 RepID=UPI002DBC7379|nr:PIN domain-containing protein [Klebsiella aerogenes]MEB5841696.1 PIN domain-containing protein [Klebsiella aerogenes]MEB5896280.1 PIN domain-containing protein [Klebsiella aerogenes]HCM6912316.1 PIN domain-containing protein [Klebsiella aerogenes]
MAFSGTILADVYDIGNYTPKEHDVFLVDTNVWYWMTYSKGIPANRQYLNAYNSFINLSLTNNSTLFHSGLSLAELAHIIEGTERKIHEGILRKSIQTKEFRHDYSKERSAAMKEVETSWLQVKSLAQQVELNICNETTDSCLSNMQTNTLDGYDLMIHECMKNHQITNIITDDGDYTSVPGINVFTCNKNVISAARSQKKIFN